MGQDTWKGSPWQPWTQNVYSYVGGNPINYTDPTGHAPVFFNPSLYATLKGLAAVRTFQDMIKAAAAKHSVDPYVLAAVVFNENWQRGVVHEVKDVIGTALSINLGGTHDVSLGVTQMTISTAAYLDSNPKPTSSGADFDDAKFENLKTVGKEERQAYAQKLLNPVTNIDYAARYLAFLQDSGLSSPETLLDAYNNNTWDDVSDYGNRYGAIKSLLIQQGVEVI